MGAYSLALIDAASLRRGESGPKVRELQRALKDASRKLNQFEYGSVDETGVFDMRTESAVRSFQMDWRLVPSGIADAEMQRALLTARSPLGRFRDKNLASNREIQHIIATIGYIPETAMTPQPVSTFTTSYAAKEWMFFDETGGGVAEKTAYLHYPGKVGPGNKSGVTLGPGYDMGQRDEEPIRKDLLMIGVDPAVAAKIAHEAAHLKDGAALAYAEKNGRNGTPLVHLRRDQQVALQNLYLPIAERRVKLAITVPLLLREFEALVSFTANPGRKGLKAVADHLNRNEVAAALKEILDRLPESISIQKGIMNRRRREVEWFITGRYTQ